MNRGAVGKSYLRLASQRDDPARARTVIVGADLAGVDRHCPGMDEDAAAGGKKARIADIELRAALDVDRPEIADRQGGSVAGIDRHLTASGGARHMDRAAGCGEGRTGVYGDRSGDQTEVRWH